MIKISNMVKHVKHKHKCKQCRHKCPSLEALNDHIKSKHTLTNPSTETYNKDTGHKKGHIKV